MDLVGLNFVIVTCQVTGFHYELAHFSVSYLLKDSLLSSIIICICFIKHLDVLHQTHHSFYNNMATEKMIFHKCKVLV